jgi:Cysteine-rich CPCC
MFENVSEPHRIEKIYRCPCCKFKTLHGRAGFELCPVCWSEDDGQDDHDADQVRGGPNGTIGLTQARSNFLSCGACDPTFVGRTRKPQDDEKTVSG